MKKYSIVLSLENIDLLKLASKASKENFEKIVFLTTKYEQIVKLEHLLCPKVGGTNPLVPPTFESGEARVPPPAPPPFYALEIVSPLRQELQPNLTSSNMLSHPKGCDKVIPEVIHLNMTSQIVNAKKF